MTRILCLAGALALVTACSSSGDKADKAKARRGDKDWAKLPLKRVNAVAKKVPFTIELPDGLEKSVDSIQVSWHFPGERRFVTPRVAVNISELPPPLTMKDAVSRSLIMSKKDTVKAKRAVDGGFLVVHHNAKKSKINATVHLKLSDKRTLYCNASQSRGGGIPNADAIMDWLAKICTTVKL